MKVETVLRAENHRLGPGPRHCTSTRAEMLHQPVISLVMHLCLQSNASTTERNELCGCYWTGHYGPILFKIVEVPKTHDNKH